MKAKSVENVTEAVLGQVSKKKVKEDIRKPENTSKKEIIDNYRYFNVKSVRLNLLITQEAKDCLRTRAKKEGKTMNALANDIFVGFGK